jgi:putative transposase
MFLGLRLPNHIHGIVIISGKELQCEDTRDKTPCKDVHRQKEGGQELNVHTSKARGPNAMSALSPHRGTLSVIIRTFKAAVTTECRDRGFVQFAWLPRFYEHIIRDGEDLDRIREYILENPINWRNDDSFPGNIRMDKGHREKGDWSALD